jgi:hypothetical protein
MNDEYRRVEIFITHRSSLITYFIPRAGVLTNAVGVAFT